MDHSPLLGIFPQLEFKQRAPVFLYRNPHELQSCPALAHHEGRQHGDCEDLQDMHTLTGSGSIELVLGDAGGLGRVVGTVKDFDAASACSKSKNVDDCTDANGDDE